jgi:putative membrane protein
MILPGISGAFILLILGKYEFITGTLKNPFSASNPFVIITFVLGCGVGLAAFSRILHYCLSHRRQETLGLLTGFMVGALRKVWPWKEAVETKWVEGKLMVLQEANIPPRQVDGDLLTAVALMAAGFTAVILLDRLSGKSGRKAGEVAPHSK